MLDLFGEFALPLDEGGHLVIVHRLHELERYFVVLVKHILDLLHSFLHDLEDGLVRIHLRLLLKIAHGVARSPYHLAAVGLLHTRYDLEERGLAGAVETYDADLGAIEE